MYRKHIKYKTHDMMRTKFINLPDNLDVQIQNGK